MRQDKLFYESMGDAILTAIRESDKEFKQVACHLWPAKKPATAYQRLKSCLNDEKDEKLETEEVIEICKFTQKFDPLYHFADECMHTRGELKLPEDEASLLKKEFLFGVKRMESLAQRLEKLGAM